MHLMRTSLALVAAGLLAGCAGPGVSTNSAGDGEPTTPDCPAEWDCALIIDKSIEFQKQWLTLSPDAVQVLVEGGHNLHEDNPDAVTAKILAALEESGP